MSSIRIPRCAKCGERAGYTPSWSPGLNLCGKHYVEAFRRRVESALTRGLRGLRVKRIIAGVSGGKDSIALLDVLAWFAERHGVEVYAVHIDLGIPGYSDWARRVAVEAFNRVGVDYIVVDAREVLGIDTHAAHVAWRRRIIARPVCAVCGMIKRRILETIARSLNADAIATGHTLDDIFSFTLQNLAGEYHERFGIVEVGEIVRLKPLAVVREADTLAYVEALKLPFLETPCPYKPRHSATGKYKFVGGVLGDTNPGVIAKLADVKYRVVKQSVPRRCVYCGAPSRESVCSACRTASRILEGLAAHTADSG